MSNPLEGFSSAQPALKLPLAQTVARVILALGLALLAGFGAYKYMAPAQLNSEADVRSRLVGVWTYAVPTDLDKPPYGWQRWTFTDGSVQIQDAKPSATGWGPASTYGYDIARRKTADTGEWYWHVRVKDTAVSAALVDGSNGLVAFMTGADSNYRLSKKDKDLAK